MNDPVQYIQIEEPTSARGRDEEPGLAIALTLVPAGLRAAISVGGNVDFVDEPPDAAVAEPDDTSLPGEAIALAARIRGLRLRLSGLTQRLVTAAVLAVPSSWAPESAASVIAATEAAGLAILRVCPCEDDDDAALSAAAVMAEDMTSG